MKRYVLIKEARQLYIYDTHHTTSSRALGNKDELWYNCIQPKGVTNMHSRTYLREFKYTESNDVEELFGIVSILEL
jgi:hypothetical protein